MYKRLDSPINGEFRPKINYGGKPGWIGIDYRASSNFEATSVMVSRIKDVTTETEKWYPLVQKAVMEASRQRDEKYAFELSINRIHTHTTDTTPEACALYGSLLFNNIAQACS